jgi:Yip1 domain
MMILASVTDEPIHERTRDVHDPDFDPYLPPRAPVGFSKPEKTRGGNHAEHVDGNPWLTMWTQPRGTIRTIVDTDPSRSVLVLAMIYGFSSTINQWLSMNTSDTVPLPLLLGIALVVGAIFGVIGNWVAAVLVRWTGSWLGGMATLQECRAAIAWGSIPCLANLAIMLGLTAVFGHGLFRSGGIDDDKMAHAILLMTVGLGQITLGIWMLVLTLKAVGEVHEFSAWKALGAFILVGLVLAGIIFGIIVMGIMATNLNK